MKNIYLDKVYQAPDKPILIVVDCRVALYRLLDRYISGYGIECWRYYLNALPSMIHKSLEKADVSLIVVDDWRTGEDYNYWRETWLQENYQEGLCYKGNRGTKSEADRPGGYNDLHKACMDYCEMAGIPVFRQAGFEADDWAGAVWRNTTDATQTIFVSVDNDWGQLMDDSKDTIQYINGNFRIPVSSIRGEYEIMAYYLEREGVSMSTSYDVVDHKVKIGDEGDNIAAGTPREVIDLRWPPVVPDDTELKLELANPSYRPNKNEATKALRKIVKAEFDHGKP